MSSTHSNVWMVGDLQGCYHPLTSLMHHPQIVADGAPEFWFAGDIINRGPDSVSTLRAVMAMGERAISVLGNHDLHFLAVAAGVKKPGKSDTFSELLDAPDVEAMIHWMRHRPLLYRRGRHVLVHAGILPAWSVQQAEALAREVEDRLRGPDWQSLMHELYGDEPNEWHDDLSGGERMRIIVNAFTRMRMCDPAGRMEFKHKGAPDGAPGLIAWYDMPERPARDHTIVFGHWSTLGLLVRSDVMCLDTGCVWGRKLTAIRQHDGKLVQVDCHQYQRPKSN